LNPALEQSIEGWEEKLDECITDIQPTLCSRELDIIKNYLMNRTNDQKVNVFRIIYLL